MTTSNKHTDALDISYTVQDAEYRELFMEGMTELLNTQQHTDVVLKAGGVEIQCHRNVLIAGTAYFRVMFSSGFKETDASTIDIKEVDGDTLTSIIQYIYSSKLKLTLNNVEPVFKAAHMFQLNSLLQNCTSFMLEHLSPSNAIDFYKLAQMYSLTKLHDDAYAIMLSKFPAIIESKGFIDLSCAELIAYIRADDLNVQSEDPVFDAVGKWINADPDTRKSSFEVLIEHLRLPHCTKLYLTNVVASSALITQPCQKYLMEAFKYKTLENREEMYSQRTKPRSCFRSRCLVTLGGFQSIDANNLGTSNRDIMYLDSRWMPFTEKYPIIDTQKLNLGYKNAVISPRGIIITGVGNTMDQTYLFDIEFKDWKSMPTMLQGRSLHTSVFHNNKVYIFGGQDDKDQLLKSAEMYSLGEASWSKLPNMIEDLKFPLVVSHGQLIFVCGGGLRNGHSSREMNAFNTTWNRWEPRQDLPEAVTRGAAVVLNDMVYVVGGGNRSCIKYDVKLDYWTLLTGPERVCYFAAAVVWQGKILIFGGGGCGTPLTDVVQEYDTEEDTWIHSKIKLHKPLCLHQVLVVDV